jgi:hypothetical protein
LVETSKDRQNCTSAQCWVNYIHYITGGNVHRMQCGKLHQLEKHFSMSSYQPLKFDEQSNHGRDNPLSLHYLIIFNVIMEKDNSKYNQFSNLHQISIYIPVCYMFAPNHDEDCSLYETLLFVCSIHPF